MFLLQQRTADMKTRVGGRKRTQMTKILFMYHLFRSASELTAVKPESEFSLFLIVLLTINFILFFTAPLLYMIINYFHFIHLFKTRVHFICGEEAPDTKHFYLVLQWSIFHCLLHFSLLYFMILLCWCVSNLGNNTQSLPQAVKADVSDILPRYVDVPPLGLIEAEQQPHNGALPATRREITRQHRCVCELTTLVCSWWDWLHIQMRWHIPGSTLDSLFLWELTYPDPLPPTMATFFPAGTSKDTPFKTFWPSKYSKYTSSKRMVASCGAMANGGARSFSYSKPSEGWDRRKTEKEKIDTQLPLADVAAQHDATLLQHLIKWDNAGGQNLHRLHEAETSTPNSRGRFKTLSEPSHVALHGDWRINRRKNFQYILSWAIVLSCSQGQQWIKRFLTLRVKACSALSLCYLIAT